MIAGQMQMMQKGGKMRLIDADSLISLVQDATILGDGFKQAFVAIVNGEPTIEPERETGKWIPHKSVFGGLGEKVYTCDQCGYNIGFHAENFCPRCGAMMEGGES